MNNFLRSRKQISGSGSPHGGDWTQRRTTSAKNPTDSGGSLMWHTAWLLSLTFLLVVGSLRSYAQVSSYSFAQTSGTYTALTTPTVLATATASTSAGSIDSYVGSATIPFTFVFNGTGYTSCNVSSNGFITFGTTAPSTTDYTPISGTAGYAGAISAWGGDINALFNVGGLTGELSYGTIGSAPNRTFIVQYKNFRPVYTNSATTAPYLNFQVQLTETTNKVVIVYGATGLAAGTANTSTTKYIGLRGATNGDYNSRTNATTVLFTSSTASTANTSTQAYASVTATPGKPSNGLTYTWTPPACSAPGGLTSSLITATTATIAWNAAATATSGYNYEVRTSGAAGSGATGLVTSGSTSSTSVALSGLNPNTSYMYFVQSNCGVSNGLSGWTAASTFATPCNPISSLPWTENFDAMASLGSGVVPSCWANVTGTYAFTSSNAASNTYNDPRSAANYMTIYYNSTASYLWTPGFSLTAGQSVDLSFFWVGDGYTGWTGDVFYNTAQNATGAAAMGASFVTAATTTSTSTYSQVTRTFVAPSAGTYYFAVKVSSNSTPYYLGFDDFKLQNTPSCLAPTVLTSSAITNNSATLSWTAPSPAPANGYKYEVRTSGAAGSGATGLVASGTSATTSVNITGLSGNTVYNFYIQSDCGASGLGTWEQGSAFTTMCDPIASLPWTENFDAMTTLGAGVVPSCWKNVTGNYAFTSSNAASITYNDPRSTPNYMTVYYNSSLASHLWTPGFTLTAGQSVDLSFYWVGDGYTGWTGDVLYNTSQAAAGATAMGASFVTSGTTTSTSAYTQVARTFVAPTSGTYYFAVRVSSNSTPFYLGFDDFMLKNTPTCTGTPAAVGIAAISSPENCTASSVTLSATSVEPAAIGLTYLWEESSDNTTWGPANGTATASGTYANMTLTPGGTRYYRLNTTCTNSASSVYSNVVTYTVGASAGSAYAWSPALVSGYTQDVISNGVGSAFTSITATFDNVGTYVLYSKDFRATASSALPTYGIPVNGIINSASNTGIRYQLAPAHEMNSLKLTSGTTTGTLTLTSPTSARQISLAASSGDGTSTMQVTVSFTDGTTQVFPGLAVSDWFGGTGFAIQGLDRMNVTTSAMDNNATNPRLYDVIISLSPANYAKTIASLTVKKTDGGATALNVMGISLNTTAPTTSNVVCNGATRVLTLPDASAGVTYQWQSSTDNASWSNIASATASTYTTAALTTVGSIYYRCVVSCTSGAISNSTAVQFTVNNGTTSASASLSAICTPQVSTATALPSTASYYWSDALGTAQTASITAAGTYTVNIVENGCISQKSVTVGTATGPIVTTQPSNPAAICGGAGTSTISVVATDVTTYEWRKNGVAIVDDAVYSGSATATLTITNPSASDNGAVFTCALTNICGTTITNTATLAIGTPMADPTVSTSAIATCAGTPVNVSATSAGSVQWFTTATGGTALGLTASGTNFAVNPSSTTTYYAEATGTTSSPTPTTETFNYSGSIVNWTVPNGVTSVNIDARGASGGYQSTGVAGKGAQMTGTYAVTPGQVLSILVGQSPGLTTLYPAGGGGTFVADGANYATATPLIAAGGGGGAYAGYTATDAPTTTSGTGTTPGTAGNGAAAGQCGGGGGGFYTSGGNDVLYSFTGGAGFRQGGQGGIPTGYTGSYQTGGFGGGAPANYVGSCNQRGGSGGGYSGGSAYGTGGGYIGNAGGSYNGGTSQVNTAGFNAGNGVVTITYTTVLPYGCVSTNRVPVTVTVNPLPVVTSAPANSTIIRGNSTSFTVATSATSPTYQWQFSTDNSTWSNVSSGTPSGVTFTNATAATLNVATTSNATAGVYYVRCVITADGCTVNSAAATFTLQALTNYTVTRNTGVTYNSIMSTGTTYTSLSSADDGTTNVVSLAGTTFNYKGVAVTGFIAVTNGWMTFNTSNTSTTYTNDLTSSSQYNVLAPMWEDLVIKGNTLSNKDISMRYKINGTLGSGSADIIIEWAEMERFLYGDPNVNFQVVLHESDNSIDYNYGNFQMFNGASNNTTYGVWTYSIGLNGDTPATGGAANRICLQAENTNYFRPAAQNSLAYSIDCYSQFHFAPSLNFNGGSAPTSGVFTASTFAPANDETAGAITLPVNASPCTDYCGKIYSSKNATATSGITACSATTPGTADDDVFFKFTTSNATNYRFAIDPSTGYDAVVQILDNTLTPVTCVNAAGAGLSELITSLALTQNAQYYVRIYDAATGATNNGEFAICISEVIPPPANDDPAGAINLTVGTTCNGTSSILPATLSATATTTSVAAESGTVADDDVWYKFTTGAIANTRYDITVSGVSVYNSVFQLCSGTPAALTLVGAMNATGNGGVETSINTTLTANTTYYIRVYHAGTGAANGNFSICVTAPAPTCIALPTAPTNASAACPSASTTFSWSATAYTTGYNVYMTLGGPATTLVSANQAGTSYTASNLAPGTYTWVVKPLNGTSEASACTSWTYTVTPLQTIALTSVSTTAAQTVCAGVSMDDPIVYSLGSGATGATVTGLPGGVTGVVSGSTFTINGTPTSGLSGLFSYTITTTGGNACTATATGTINVLPAQTIVLGSASGAASQTVNQAVALTPITYNVGGSATNASVTGLPSGMSGSYSGGVFTISGSSTSTGTYNYTVTTSGSNSCTAVAQGTITVNNACSSTVTLSSGTVAGTAITVTWPSVYGAGWFEFRYKESSSSTWINAGTLQGSITSKQFTGLTPSTSYDFQIKSFCGQFSYGAWGPTLTVSTIAASGCYAAPVLTASTVGATTGTVTWPVIAGSSYYEFRYRASGATIWTTGSTISGSGTSKVFNNLTSNTTYEVQARTYCTTGGGSAWGTTTTFTTTAGSACNAAPVLTNTAVTISSATVTWPTIAGAAWYEFRYKASTSSTWISGGTMGATAVQKVLSGLTGGTTYDFQGRTYCNQYEASSWSSTLNFTTPAAMILADTDPTAVSETTTVLEEKTPETGLTVQPSVVVYPNPATTIVNVALSLEVASDIQVVMIDQLGRVLEQSTEHHEAGSVTIRKEVTNYAIGMYTLHIFKDGELIHVAKVEKQ
jgi:hypothetical protein